MPAHRRSKSKSAPSRSRSHSRAHRHSSTKKSTRPLSDWNRAIKKAMAQLKREGWNGDPKDRMKAAAKIAHEITGK